MKKTTQEQEDKKLLENWEKEFNKFYTFRFEWTDNDVKRRFEICSINDPMSLEDALEMARAHARELKHGTITDFIECDAFKEFVYQLLAAQSRVSYREGVEAAIIAITEVSTTSNVWKLTTIKNVCELLTPPTNEEKQ